MLFQTAVHSGIQLCPMAQLLQPLRLATNNLNQYKVPRICPLRIHEKCLVNPCIKFVTVRLQVVTMMVQNPMDGLVLSLLICINLGCCIHAKFTPDLRRES